MKYILILCVLSTIGLKAQDKILTISQDTIIVKITSLENQKVNYYLLDDSEKKNLELPYANLHKIVWRNKQEYIINQVFEEKLKREKPVFVAVDKQEKVVDSNPQKEVKYYTNAPDFEINNWLFWRSYVRDGSRISNDLMSSEIYKYDYESYNIYQKGEAFDSKAARKRKASWILWVASIPVYSFVPILGLGLNTASAIVSIGYGRLRRKGLREKRAALEWYDLKKQKNQLIMR